MLHTSLRLLKELDIKRKSDDDYALFVVHFGLYLFFVFNLRCVILFFNCNFLFGDYFEENSD